MIWPVPGHYTVTSGFADTRSYGMHAGFDIAAPAVPCVAVASGVIIYTGWAGSAGRSVYIALDNGYRVHYCHLSRTDVAVEQRVAAGDVIGLVGGSGDGIDGRWGSHLHLNLFAAAQPTGEPSKWIAWVGMWAVDPELYLDVVQEEDGMALSDKDKELLDRQHKETLRKIQWGVDTLAAYHNTTRDGIVQQASRVINKLRAQGTVGAVSDEDVQQIAEAVADEQHRRMKE